MSAKTKPFFMWEKMKFQVSAKKIRTMQGYSRTSNMSVEEQENGTNVPKQNVKYKEGDEITFTVPLNYAFCDVQKEINGWQQKMEKKKESYMYQNGKLVSEKKFILTGVTENETEWNGKGIKIKAVLNLTFKEQGATKKLKKKKLKKLKKAAKKYKYYK